MEVTLDDLPVGFDITHVSKGANEEKLNDRGLYLALIDPWSGDVTYR